MEELLSNLPESCKTLLEQTKGSFVQGLQNAPGYKEPGWKGYRYSMHFSSDATQKIYEECDFPENSVILASFPKTGTNWISEIIYEMLFGFDEKFDTLRKEIPPPFFVLEGWSADKMELWKHIPLPHYYFMSHLPAPLINFGKIKKSNSKIVVPIRNPKDQLISWFNYCQSPNFAPLREHLSSDWSQFFSDFIEGKQPIPVTKPGEGYAEFLRGWNEYKDDPSVYFVHFENLKTNTTEEMSRIAKFLGKDLTEEQLTLLKEKTSFESMKKMQEKGSDEMAQFRKSMNLVRKGKVGSWKDTFTVSQSERMDEMMATKLTGTDIKFIY